MQAQTAAAALSSPSPSSKLKLANCAGCKRAPLAFNSCLCLLLLLLLLTTFSGSNERQQLLANCSPVVANSAIFEQSALVAKCCSVGKTSAVANSKFSCKMSARSALLAAGDVKLETVELALKSDSAFADQCEMTLESCCIAQHRTRNCDAGRQFARSGNACMDVELSKEATLATESFNDCCMACSLGLLAAKTAGASNSSSLSSSSSSASSASARCKLSSSLQNSFPGLLYERTYVECCEESLPRPPLSSLVDTDAQVDCRQANPCAQKCVPAALQLSAAAPTHSAPLMSMSLSMSSSSSSSQHSNAAVDKCDCFAGYKLASDNFSCIDIDECQYDTHSCNRESEVCDNTIGGFRCLARAGNNGHLVARAGQSSLAQSKGNSRTVDAWPFLIWHH